MGGAELVARFGTAAKLRVQQAGLLNAARPPFPEVKPCTQWLIESAAMATDSVVSAADRIVRGDFRVFSRELPQGSEVRAWNRDPLTGVLAPLTFGPTLDLYSRRLVGDIKYLWEPNRHADLVTLALAFRATGNEQYRECAFRLLSSWFEQCPYLRGPNWASGLELGIRLINWAAAWQLLRIPGATAGSEGADAPLHDDWRKSIYQHVHFVRGHYSKHSSANNHLIGEASGVFIACCTWPFWRDFERWREEAFQIVIEETLAQSTPDGASREQATAYQLFVLQFQLLNLLAGRASGVEFPGTYAQRVHAMLLFLAELRDVNGHLPMIGDSDDGSVLRLSHETDFCSYRSAFATGALLLDDAALARAAGNLDDQTRHLVDATRWERLVSAELPNRGERRTSFTEGGYYILGEGFGTQRELRLMVDSGPLGYRSIAAHGHADALAIYLSAAGKEFLVDPGTYTYHGQREWRAHFRSTRAHNTLTVDGMDQSVQAGSFMWLKHANTQCLQYRKGEAEDLFVGEHDGYRRLSDPVTHRRTIRRIGGTFQVEDLLVCKGNHEVEQWWQFSEECVVVVVNGVVIARNAGSLIRLNPQAKDAAVQFYCGSEHPIAGWASRQYEVKVAAAAIRVTTRISGTARLVTVIECERDWGVS